MSCSNCDSSERNNKPCTCKCSQPISASNASLTSNVHPCGCTSSALQVNITASLPKPYCKCRCIPIAPSAVNATVVNADTRVCTCYKPASANTVNLTAPANSTALVAFPCKCKCRCLGVAGTVNLTRALDQSEGIEFQ